MSGEGIALATKTRDLTDNILEVQKKPGDGLPSPCAIKINRLRAADRRQVLGGHVRARAVPRGDCAS